MKKRTIIYIFIIFIFALLSFIQWKCEFNMTFKMFKEVIENTYFIEQWRYLTYANSKVFILVYPIIITYFGLKDFITQVCFILLQKEQITNLILKILF